MQIDRDIQQELSRLWIDGELAAARGSATYEGIDPATEEPFGTYADASPEDMTDAIGAARTAFDKGDWSSDASLRRRCLEALAEELRALVDQLRPLFVHETGNPISLARASFLDGAVDALPHWAAMATDYAYREECPPIEIQGAASRRSVAREPVGVVAAITPWNSPFQLSLQKIGPALAAGNTVVLKPAPDTPWSGGTMIGLAASRVPDLPRGVFNVVVSSGNEVGDVLTGDPRVDMVTFTGSTATGRRVGERAAQTIKRVTLELGGKSAVVVLDDADVAAAAAAAAQGVCWHAGQGCALITRLLLPRSRYEEGIEAARRAMAAVPCGDPFDPMTLTGPLVNARQYERVIGYCEKGVSEGARLVLGGGRPVNLDRGYFVEPTLFADVDPGSTIAQEEIFGPVLVAIPYENDDDAIEIANGTKYGLAAAVAGTNEDRALAIADRLRAGNVAVNGGVWFGLDMPFGGYKQSGNGRENGRIGFEEYLESKSIAIGSAA